MSCRKKANCLVELAPRLRISTHTVLAGRKNLLNPRAKSGEQAPSAEPPPLSWLSLMATTILGSFFGRSGGGGGVGKGAGWTFVGRTSEFPDVDGLDENNLAEKRPCRGGHGDVNEVPGCKVFRIPRTVTGPPVEDGDASIEEIAPEDAGAPEHMKGMRDQVLVFRYKGKFHAVDNVSSPILTFFPLFLF